MLDELIKEMETNPTKPERESPSFGNKLRYLQGLAETTEQIGKLVLKTKQGLVEKYFCYGHKRNGGHVITRDKGGISSMVSYGNISKEDFVKKHFKIEPEESECVESKEDKHKRVPYPLMAMPIIFLPAAFYAAKKIYEHKKEKGSE
jgi:hypothetical protein